MGTERTINQLLARPPRFGGQDVDPLNGEAQVPDHSFSLVDHDLAITELISVSDTPKNKTFITATVAVDQDFIPVDDVSGFADSGDLYLNRETIYFDGKALDAASGSADWLTGFAADADPTGASAIRVYDAALSAYASDYFKGAWIEFTSGANNGVSRRIERQTSTDPLTGLPWADSDEQSYTLYIDPRNPFPNNVTVGDVYRLTQAPQRIYDAARTEADAEAWQGAKVLITADATNPVNIGEIRFVKAFDPALDVLEFYEPLPAPADSGTQYTIAVKKFTGCQRGMYGSEAAEHSVIDPNGEPVPVDLVDKPPFMKTRRVTIYENRQGLDEDQAVARHGVIDDYILDASGVVYRFKVSGLLRLLSRKVLSVQAKGNIARKPLWGGGYRYVSVNHVFGGNAYVPSPTMEGSEIAEFSVTEIFLDEIPRGFHGGKVELPAGGGNIKIGSEIIRYQSVSQFFELFEGYLFVLILAEHVTWDSKDIVWVTGDTAPDALALNARGLFVDKIGIKDVQAKPPADLENPIRESLYTIPDVPACSAFMAEHSIGDEILQVIMCEDSARSDFPRFDEIIFTGSTGTLPDLPFTVTGAVSGHTATVTEVLEDIPTHTGTDNGVLSVIEASGDFEAGEGLTSGAWSADVDEHRIGDGVELPARNNPINVFLALLLSTGTRAANGKYDVLQSGFGIGIDVDLIDVAGIEALRDAFFSSSRVDFVVSEPTPLKELFEDNLFKYLQIFPLENEAGKISLSYMFTEAEAGVLDDEVGLTEIAGDEIEARALPDWSSGQIPVTKVIIKYNRHPVDDEYFSKLEVNFPRARKYYGDLGRTIKLETAFLYLNHSTLAALSPDDPELPEMIARVINPMWGRHSNYPAPVIKLRAPYSQNTLSVGQVIKLTHPSMPNLRTSGRGFSDEYFQIMGIEPDPEGGMINLTLWQIGVHDLKYARKAPSAVVYAYTADGGGAGKARIDTYRTIYSKTGQMDLDHFKVDNVVAFLTPTYDPEGALTAPETAEIESITADGVDSYIILKTNLTDPPAQRHLIELWDYDNQLSVSKSTRTWLANEDRVIGTAEDTAFKYK